METTVVTKPQIVVEQRVVLHEIPWSMYQDLMIRHADRSAPRFTYDQGELEIYMPTQKHERNAETLKSFVEICVLEWDVDFLALGSTTWKNEKFDKGVEADGCFYIQNYESVFGVEKIDLEINPPPDLVIEIDVTSPSINRFPIYADFRVPEIWRFFNETVKIYVLKENNYLEASESLALPRVTGLILTECLAQAQTSRRSAWLKNVREWASRQDSGKTI